MSSNAGKEEPIGNNTPQTKKQVTELKQLSRNSSTGYPSAKTTTSKTHVSKRSSNPSSSSSNARHAQGNYRSNTRLHHALRNVGSQFGDSARVETIREEIEISTSTNANGLHNQDLQQEHQQEHRTRRPRASQPEFSRIFNHTMKTYLQSQGDPSQQYALFCRCDNGQLSTQREKYW